MNADDQAQRITSGSDGVAMTTPAELISNVRALLSKASPRPWRLCCSTGGGCESIFVWAEDDQERPALKADKTRDKYRENMTLAAAAPDLLHNIATALEQSESARIAAHASASQALRDLADMRKEHGDLERWAEQARPVVDASATACDLYRKWNAIIPSPDRDVVARDYENALRALRNLDFPKGTK